MERQTLLSWSRRAKTAQALALRAKIVLACADGAANKDVAAALGIWPQTVTKWRGGGPAGQPPAGVANARIGSGGVCQLEASAVASVAPLAIREAKGSYPNSSTRRLIRSAWASAAVSDENWTAMVARRRTFATSTGMRCGRRDRRS